ncbi:MAG TPA: hypothetical protein VMJ66_14580 [Geobacteraceae bacterium]|nr:hypothetical protein [Geobacteraceae bacterium]
MTKKIHNMAVFIEFIAGSGLAIFFHLVLHDAEAAYIIFGIGVLLSLATYLLREDIAQTREKLIDQYDHSHEITFTIARMTDPECQAKAHEIMAGAKRTLALLEQGYVPLDETEFYLKGTKYMDESRHRARLVDPVTSGWDSRGSLVNYYQANLRAVERGVQVTRIFVINREELADVAVQKVLLAQLRDGIEVRVAYHGELPMASDITGRDTNNTFDFAIYDDQVATEVFSQSGKYFGRKTRVPSLVGNYQHLYELIEHSSHAVTAIDDRIVLAAELLPLAS